MTTDPSPTPVDPREEELARAIDSPAFVPGVDAGDPWRRERAKATARRALAWFDTLPRTVTAEEVDAAALAVLVSEQETDEMRQAAPRAWSRPGFAGERERYRAYVRVTLPALRLEEGR